MLDLFEIIWSQLLRFAILQSFLAIFCQVSRYISQNLGADSHFERLNVSKFQLDQNLWHKSLCQVYFSILEETNWKSKFQKWPFYNHFWSFFGNYINIFCKTEIQMVILRCLVCKNYDLIKSRGIILIKSFFFHAWKCIISGLVCRSEFWHLRMKSLLVFSKWILFKNSLELSWDT